MVAGPRDVAEATVASKVYSTTTTTQLGQVVVNPDGTNIVAGLSPSAPLADATANPTITSIGVFNLGYNGTTWDRMRSGQTGNSTTVTGIINNISMGRYNASPTARTEGQFGVLQTDSAGNLNINLGTTVSGENQTTNRLMIEHAYTYARMSAATTTTHFSGAGFLQSITVNKAVAAGTITIYDNTAGSGTIVGVITFGAALLSDPPHTAIYNVFINTGLTIVTSAATDITIAYRVG